MLSGLKMFKAPYREHYADKMEHGLKIRMVFGGEEEVEEIEEIKALRNEYDEQIKIRYSPSISRTSKGFIVDDVLAMDGTKLLPVNREGLSYIGTMYVEEDECVKNPKRTFENLWKMSKSIS